MILLSISRFLNQCGATDDLQFGCRGLLFAALKFEGNVGEKKCPDLVTEAVGIEMTLRYGEFSSTEILPSHPGGHHNLIHRDSGNAP